MSGVCESDCVLDGPRLPFVLFYFIPFFPFFFFYHFFLFFFIALEVLMHILERRLFLPLIYQK